MRLRISTAISESAPSSEIARSGATPCGDGSPSTAATSSASAVRSTSSRYGGNAIAKRGRHTHSARTWTCPAIGRVERFDSPLVLSLSKDERLARDGLVEGRAPALMARRAHHERVVGVTAVEQPAEQRRRL